MSARRTLTALLLLIIWLPLPGAARAVPPNIVLVMADDLGWGDVAYNGNDMVHTPHLDTFAREGVRLDRFYAAAPVCSPTRASCLTGRHPYRYNIPWAGEDPLPAEEVTLAETLREAGYATGHFGKWHVGMMSRTVKQSYFEGPVDPAKYSPPWENGFDVCFSTASMMPTYNPYYHVGGDFGTEEYLFLGAGPVARGQRTGGFRWRDVYWTGPGQFEDTWLEGDDSTLITDRALAFMEQNAAARRPFLALVWFHTPHTPVVAGNEDRAPYADQSMPAQHWFGAISAMDRQVGRIRQQLRQVGIADNTVVWFCSDNGPSYIHDYNSAGPFRGKKATLWEGGIRVPAIVEWPGRLPGKRTLTAAMSTSDFYPTLVTLARATPTYQPVLDGEDVWPILLGQTTDRKTPIGFQAPHKRPDNPFAEPGSLQAALQQGPYKLITFDAGERYLLFDLDKDPGEEHDLAPARPEKVTSMAATLEAWQRACTRSASGADYP